MTEVIFDDAINSNLENPYNDIINMVDALKNNKCCIVEGKDLLLKCLKKESKSIDKSKIKDQRDHLKLLEEATKL